MTAIATATSDGIPGEVAVALSWREARPLRALGQDEPDPWALPLVVRVERTGAPAHEAVLTAAALAVVALLGDARVAPGSGPEVDPGPWRPPLEQWLDGRIRKLARRARATRWDALSELPGVTVAVPGGEVRALLPHPVSAPPPEIDRLQIGGLDLPGANDVVAGHPSCFRLPAPDTAAGVPADADSDAEVRATGVRAAEVLTIAVNPRLSMTTGKSVAQVAHASQLALMLLPEDRVAAWAAAGFPLQLTPADAPAFENLVRRERPEDGIVAVRDAGFTEVAPGSVTCVARLAPQPRQEVSGRLAV